MRVNVLSYEPAGGWILYNFAERLVSHLRPLVEAVDLTHAQAPDYDVTYHVNYWGLRGLAVPGLHCTMLTHIDTAEKFGLAITQANAGVWGMCMSEDTTRRMSQMSSNHRFASFAPPAMIEPPNRRASVLIASRLYPDGRKNEQWVFDFIHRFPPHLLAVRIIGAGWAEQVEALRQRGFAVEHHEDFDREVYKGLLAASDYLLYTGFDEGALSTLDAILYGVTPIVSAQGYHLEHSADMLLFAGRDQLMAIADRLIEQLLRKQAALRDLTDWDAFARKHVAFWQDLLSEAAVADTELAGV